MVRSTVKQVVHIRLSYLQHVLLSSFLALCLALTTLVVNAAESITLQLKWTHCFEFAGYYAAQMQGYYRDAGLDVTIKEIQPHIDVVDEVVSGRADFATGNSGLLLSRNAGKPVVVLASIFQHSPLVLVAKQDSSSGSLHDLIGKRVMLEPLSDEIQAYLKAEGIALNRIQPVKHTFDLQDLLNNKTDAMTAYSTNEPYFLDRAGFKYVTYTPRSAGIDFYGDNLFTSEQQLRQHPERVKAFREASLRGWQYAMRHPEAIIELMLKQYPQAQNTREYYRFEAQQMRALVRPDIVELGYMTNGRWEHIAETYADMQMLPKDFSLKGFLYTPDQNDTEKKKLLLSLVLSLLGLTAVSAIAYFAVRTNRRMKVIQAKLEDYQNNLTQKVYERTAALTLAKEAAEAANQAKSSFIATMSHELRTPMATMMGYIFVLKRGVSAEIADELFASLEQTTDHFMDLLNDVIDYSSIVSRRLHMTKVAFELPALLEYSLQRYAKQAEHKGLQLSLEIAPDVPNAVQGDPVRVSQVIASLLSNAVKFSTHGKICLRTTLREKSAQELILMVEVEDQGVGVDPGVKEDLFQLFNQGDNSATRKHDGTGLGLALCKQLVNMMGGEIDVRNNADEGAGCGSTFWFTMRLQKQDESLFNSQKYEPQDWSKISAVISYLSALLAVEDMHARALWVAARRLLERLFAEELSPFVRAIEVFDFNQAHGLLQQVVAAHPELLRNTSVQPAQSKVLDGERLLLINPPLDEGLDANQIKEKLKQTGSRLTRMRGFYVALFRMNEAMLHANDEQTLWQDICDIAVQEGLMTMAWIGIEDVETKQIRPLIKRGTGTDYLDEIVISIDSDLPEGLGMTGCAWREQKTMIINDVVSNVLMAPWYERVKKFGWRSSASFPILRHGKTYAILSVYHLEAQAFDTEVVGLLEAMVKELSFALDRLAIDQALIKSESFSRLFLESVSAGIWGLDTQGNTTFINPAASKMLGYAAEEMVGKLAHPLVHHMYADGAYYPQHDCHMSATCLDGQSRRVSNEVLWCKDGTSLPVEYAVHPIYSQGVITGAVVVFQDISERIKTEVEMAKLKLALEQSPSSVLITNTDAEIEYVNEKFTEIFGYSREEALGKNPSFLKSGYTDSEQYAEIWSLLRQGINWSGELSDRRKDGREIVVRSSISPVHQLDGKVTHYVAMQQDVSQEKLASAEIEALRHNLQNQVDLRTAELATALETIKQNEERFAYAIDATHDGIWDWNLVTDTVYYNAAYFSMLGFLPQDIDQTGSSGWLALMHPEDRERALQHVMQSVMQSGSHETEFRMCCKDGSYKWILGRGKAVAYDASGKPTRMIGTHTDVSARKEFELQLRSAKESAELASQSKTLFLANMSHEIRTPMNAIVGLTHLLKTKVSEPQQYDLLEKISVSAKHLMAIISDVLDLSKIEVDHLKLEEVGLDIEATILHVVHLMRESVDAKHLLLTYTTDEKLKSVSLIGDPLRVAQILINYVSNAVKFTEQGSICLRVILESLAEDVADIRFEVQDTGIGIAEENQEHIFDDFVQAETSTTRNYGGTGLGLAIAKRLAIAMHGEAGVVSQLGQGSTFWFTAKFKIGDVPKRIASQEGAGRIRAGALVLLVEDNLINQLVASNLLQDVGLRVDIAKNGQEALNKLKNHDGFQATSYDLILTDMRMPIMDGLEMTRRIRGQGMSIPIIAMTANAFQEDYEQCIAAGMNGYVSKPVEPSDLYAMLGLWMPDQLASSKTEYELAGANDAGLALHEESSQKNANTPLIDIEEGLRFFGGKRPSYLRMLASFPNLHGKDADELRQALVQEDFYLANRLVHTLKGVASTMGMLSLRDCAAQLEKKLFSEMRDAGLETMLADFSALLEQVCEEINRMRINQRGLTLIDVEPEYLSHLILQLENQLIAVCALSAAFEQEQATAQSMQISATWIALGDLLAEAIGDDVVESLRLQLSGHAFLNALQSLRDILKTYPGLRLD